MVRVARISARQGLRHWPPQPYDLFSRVTDFQRGELGKTHAGGRYNQVVDELAHQAWTYDSLGRWVTFQDGPHKYGQGGLLVEKTYDAQGNLESVLAADRRATKYDAWDRVVDSRLKNRGSAGENPSSFTLSVNKYAYDALGRMVRRTNYNVSSVTQEPTTVHYVVDFYQSAAWQNLLEVRAAGAGEQGQAPYERENVWSLGYVDGLVLQDRSTDGWASRQRLYALQDANWNVTTVLGQAEGAWEPVIRVLYSPYGVPAQRGPDWDDADVSSYDWTYLHQGGYYAALTAGRGDNLYHFRHRAYAPAVGQWLQRGSSGSADSLNLHEYAGSNPSSRGNTDGTHWYDYIASFGKGIAKGALGIVEFANETVVGVGDVAAGLYHAVEWAITGDPSGMADMKIHSNLQYVVPAVYRSARTHWAEAEGAGWGTAGKIAYTGAWLGMGALQAMPGGSTGTAAVNIAETGRFRPEHAEAFGETVGQIAALYAAGRISISLGRFAPSSGGVVSQYTGAGASAALRASSSSGVVSQFTWGSAAAALGAVSVSGVVSAGSAVRGTLWGATSREVLTGQVHHGISARVFNALERNPTLKGLYELRDPRFATQGRDLASHYGYQQWHRALDREVSAWIDARRGISPAEFEAYLRQRYSDPHLLNRFPKGLGGGK